MVPLPGPVERRLRLGPFASTRDALKFVTYAAVGALLAPFVSPYAWLPVLGLGFGVSVWRPDGEAVDERIGRWIGWSWRHLGGTPMTRATARSVSTGNFARLGPGRYADGPPVGRHARRLSPPRRPRADVPRVRRRASSFGWGPRPARGNRSPDSRPPPPARRSRAGNRTERARGVSGTGLSPLSPAPGSYGRSRPVRIREGPRGPGSARGAYAGASRTAHRPRPPFQPTAGAWSGRRGAPNGVVLGRTGRVTAAGRTPRSSSSRWWEWPLAPPW